MPRAVALRVAVALVTVAVLSVPVRGLLDGEPSGAAADAGLVRGGAFTVGISEPASLLPGSSYFLSGSGVMNALFTPLVTYDPETAQPEMGGVAESVESSDQQVWTITLKEGWTFHNGEPVTAQSYVDSWNFAAYGPNEQGNGYYLERVAGYWDVAGNDPAATTMHGLQALDDRTLRVTLSEPFSQFPLQLGIMALAPIPSSAVEEIMAAEAGDARQAAMTAFEEAPIGNGPFRISGRAGDGVIQVTRFADYQGPAPYADDITFRVYDHSGAAADGLLAGDVDVIGDVMSGVVDELERDFGDRVATWPSSIFQYLGFPLHDERFQNPDLRRALSLAIDRQAIIDQVLDGTAVPANSYVSQRVAGAREDPCGEWCNHDPERARELLERAGGWEGTLTLWLNSGSGNEAWVQAVAEQWRRHLGIRDVEVRPLEMSDYLRELGEGRIDGPYRLGWAMDYPSPGNFLEGVFQPDSGLNYSGYDNPAVIDLITQANAAGSVEAGIELLQQAEDAALEDLPLIPLWFSTLFTAHSERVTNVTLDRFGRLDVAGIALAAPE